MVKLAYFRETFQLKFGPTLKKEDNYFPEIILSYFLTWNTDLSSEQISLFGSSKIC